MSQVERPFESKMAPMTLQVPSGVRAFSGHAAAAVLIAFAAFSLFAGVMAKFVLSPMRKRLLKAPDDSHRIPAADLSTARVR